MIAMRPLTSPTTSSGSFSRGIIRFGIERLGSSNTLFLDSIVGTKSTIKDSPLESDTLERKKPK